MEFKYPIDYRGYIYIATVTPTYHSLGEAWITFGPLFLGKSYILVEATAKRGEAPRAYLQVVDQTGRYLEYRPDGRQQRPTQAQSRAARELLERAHFLLTPAQWQQITDAFVPYWQDRAFDGGCTLAGRAETIMHLTADFQETPSLAEENRHLLYEAHDALRQITEAVDHLIHAYREQQAKEATKV